MSRTLGLGLVGAGTIAGRIMNHLAVPDVQDAVRVVHVCDPVPGRAAAVAERFAVPRAGQSYEELLADPAVDIVCIASPIGLHYEQGMAAIKAGKHVHFNKTIATTAAEATALIDAARAADVKLVASPGEVLRPHLIRIKELIAEGAIGTPIWAAAGCALWTYHEDEPERTSEGGVADIDPSWYFRKPGGGPLYDMTVYALHAMTGVLGSVQRVTAMSGVRIEERQFKGRAIKTEADDNTLVLMDFGNNLFALAYGTASGILSEDRSWDPDPRIYGTGGQIIRDTLNGVPFDYPGAELARTPVEGESWVVPGPELILPHITPAHYPFSEWHVFEDLMQLVDWVRLDKPSPVTAEHARHVVEIIEAAYRAAETGQTQVLTTTIDGLVA
ncbi:MAG: Gfo/Idh/MocA family oxidoreductase [Chloroflexota bacterium]